MKEKTKIIIVASIAVIVIVLIGLLLFLKPKAREESAIKDNIATEKEAENYIKEFTDIIINNGSKQDILKAIYNEPLFDTDFMTGPDSYLRQKPKNDLIQKYHLEKYTKKASEMATHLDQKIEENFDYKIEGVATGKDYYSVLVTYRTYYYRAYLSFLHQIQNELLIKAGYQLDGQGTPSEKFTTDLYKAKVKAATLLDPYLDEFINANETKKVYVTFDEKKASKSSKSLKSYLINLTGYTYDNSVIVQQFQTKIPTILENIDSKNLFSL